jgi:hypothetical protein
MSKTNNSYQFSEFNFGQISESELNLVELLVKHQYDFPAMDELKNLLERLYFNESNSKRA